LDRTLKGALPMPDFLDRERSIAGPRFDRWLVPPAALAIHLSVGQAYAFSVFNKPLGQMLGISKPAPGDWPQTQISIVFSIAIVFLGLSAAVFGKWLEAVGPRKAMFVSAVCFGSGFLVAAVGLWQHQFWLVCAGYGVLGGIGLGLGYISPVSTLLKWFPDRPGMATGMAIMGFGGGAMIGSPLAVNLMSHFAGPHSTGVAPTFVWMGVIYFVFMMFGVFTVRMPPEHWTPAGFVAATTNETQAALANVTADQAIRTPQFWLLWCVLFVNVTAGIGVLSQASPMIQEVFKDRVNKDAAAGFVGLLSLFNLAGRFLWSSFSDVIGRKRTYMIYFLLGIVLYGAAPTTGRIGSVALFVACFAIILSMYGGGFATVPAYLRDLFGTTQVGAIHGRLLTAWSAAGICGPILVAYLYDFQKQRGASSANSYLNTMYVMAGLLFIGLIANALVKAVEARCYAPEQPAAQAISVPTDGVRELATSAVPTSLLPLALSWLVVLIPLGWGVAQTVVKSLALFR
jgi:MFS family permease